MGNSVSGTMTCLYCVERLKTSRKRNGEVQLAYTRGVCLACRNRQDYMIHHGKTTEKELLEQGFLLPPKPVGSGWRHFKQMLYK